MEKKTCQDRRILIVAFQILHNRTLPKLSLTFYEIFEDKRGLGDPQESSYSH